MIPWDGTLGDESEEADDTRCCKSGLIRRIGTTWPGQFKQDGGLIGQMVPGANGPIKIVYTAGWTLGTMPRTIVGAVCDIAMAIKRGAKFGGMLNSESWQGYSYSLANPGAAGKYPQPGSLQSKLNRYRRLV